MSTIKTKDGTAIYYKDWGKGPAVTFSHGWPLSSDMWDGQMLFLAQNGCRVIAHDRRGHGRSDQASTRNDMDGYADDLAELITALDLRDVTVVGHSTGGGEVARYIGRHGGDQDGLGDPSRAVTPDVAGDFSTTGRVSDHCHVPEIEGRDEGRQVVGVPIHVVPGRGLVGTSVAALVMCNGPIAVLGKEQHLSVPHV